MRGVAKRKLLVAGGALLVSLGLAELVVRVTIGAPLPERLPIMEMRPHPTRGWAMVPGQDHYTYEERVTVNSLGLRGPEVGDKPEGTRRVLALGDSLTYGQGVGDDETLPHYLAGFLNELDPGGRAWEVVNGGHRAYATHQEVAMAEELVPELEPDVLVLFWYWNDLKERDVPGTFERLSAREGPVAFDTNEVMEGPAALSWHARQLLRRSALLMLAYDLFRGGGEQPVGERFRADGLARLGRHLDRLLELARSRELPVWFVIVPDAHLLTGEHASGPIADGAAVVAAERGIPVVDLLETLRAFHRAAGDVPVIPYDGHYLPEANRVLARATARALLGLGG